MSITVLFEKSGYKMFASLHVSTDKIKVYGLSVVKGLTVFAPNDKVFKAADGAFPMYKLKHLPE